MKLKDFYYDLPEELIAQEPIKNREESRLLVLDKNNGKIEHKIFKDIIDYLNEGDCLVLNDTKVIPARLYGTKKNTGARIEIVLLKEICDNQWEVLVRPGKRVQKGCLIIFGDNNELSCEVVDILEGGNRLVRFDYEGIFLNILDKIGLMPLPPYIKAKLEDKGRYQTVYAKNPGSAAAPTAGLHFTGNLLNEIRDKGIKVAYTTLNIGLGTFRPVKVDDIEEHKMHSEYYEINQEACDIINRAKENGGRIISVGTTASRVLETVADTDGKVSPYKGWTDIFIYPGYRFKVVDSLITNFHLPESTLLMLVSALAGRENIIKAYNEAVACRYRFFSFGDAMVIK
ncbi:MAG: tRNA preQ1(34) S-adenosylmethionine ribosyltransferase-isomerase QueA [Deltaproteobacteria bacterium]